MTTTSTDRIEKQVLIHAPRSRVWQAITDYKQFGEWFRVELEGPFEAGMPARGKVTYPGYEDMKWEMVVDRIDAEHLFSFRWHPYGIDPGVDYSSEPMTLIVFELEEVADGTLLRLTESGFDQIPLERRAKAFEMNSMGWAEQMKNIERYVAKVA